MSARPVDDPAAAYAAVAYTSDAQAQTHPDRLATLGRLFGMAPADPAACRVLEIGCGSGGNLIPMAYGLPGASFTGIDIASAAIERAQRRAQELALPNLTLRVADIRSLDASLGRFDFVVAHGVYSWVPEAVRRRILALCRELLAPHGIAYVSYNALPGWHLYQASRAMMRYQAAQYEGEARQVEEARGLLRMLRDAQPGDTLYGRMLADEAERLERYPDWFLVHDHLAEVNEAFYFHQFAADLRAHALQYLGEADVEAMYPTGFPAWVAQALDGVASLEQREQYMDFFRGRRFRKSLVVHADVALRRPVEAAAVRGLLVSAPVRRVDGEGPARFAGHRGRTVEAEHPLTRAALDVLGASWPRRVGFEAVAGGVAERLGAWSERDAAMLEALLFGLCRDGFARLHTWDPGAAAAPSARPLASAVARAESAASTLVTNLYHDNVPVEAPEARRLLTLLDGTRTTAELAAMLPAPHDAVIGLVQGFARVGLLHR